MKSYQSKLEKRCNFSEKCGGCDFLDLTENDYQKLKKENLEKSLFHLLQNPSEFKAQAIEYYFIEPKSRRKISLQIDSQNRLGFFAKKTNSLVEVDSCFIAEEKISALILPLKKFIKSQEFNLFNQVSLTLFDNGLELIFYVKKELNFLQIQKFIAFAKEYNLNISYKIKNQLTPIYLPHKNQIFYSNFKIDLSSEVFIQATAKGLNKIVEIIRNFLIENKTIKNVADIYAGFGAYSFAICDLVFVSAFEGSEEMVDIISKNAAANSLSHKIKALEKDLFQDALTKKELEKFDLIIINPPRNGATPQIIEIAKSKVKNIIYVSCNPKTFAFDAKILIDSGFKIKNLTAIDQFYASKHLELVTIFGR